MYVCMNVYITSRRLIIVDGSCAELCVHLKKRY